MKQVVICQLHAKSQQTIYLPQSYILNFATALKWSNSKNTVIKVENKKY